LLAIFVSKQGKNRGVSNLSHPEAGVSHSSHLAYFTEYIPDLYTLVNAPALVSQLDVVEYVNSIDQERMITGLLLKIGQGAIKLLIDQMKIYFKL
jgi:hypothetical protein